MANKKRIGVLGAMALGLATALGGAQQANALVPVQENVRHQENKEALPEVNKPVRPVSEKNRFGGWSGVQNPYKHIVTPKKNQRQIRKWKRQNPNAW